MDPTNPSEKELEAVIAEIRDEIAAVREKIPQMEKLVERAREQFEPHKNTDLDSALGLSKRLDHALRQLETIKAQQADFEKLQAEFEEMLTALRQSARN